MKEELLSLINVRLGDSVSDTDKMILAHDILELLVNPFLSPVDSERSIQEKRLKRIFPHYPDAHPNWQYLNGLLSLGEKQMNIPFKIEEERPQPTTPRPRILPGYLRDES